MTEVSERPCSLALSRGAVASGAVVGAASGHVVGLPSLWIHPHAHMCAGCRDGVFITREFYSSVVELVVPPCRLDNEMVRCWNRKFEDVRALKRK